MILSGSKIVFEYSEIILYINDNCISFSFSKMSGEHSNNRSSLYPIIPKNSINSFERPK